MITVKKMLKVMETGEAFSLTFVTCDLTRKKGGAVKTYAEAMLSTKVKDKPVRPLTKVETQKAIIEGNHRNPNHGIHFTRNITILQQGQLTGMIHKIRPQLVTIFNGQKVV